jgi:hypothetical protein
LRFDADLRTPGTDVRPLGSASNYAIEERVLHQLNQVVQISLMRVIETASAHYHDDQSSPIILDVLEEDRAILANGDAYGEVKLIHTFFDNEPRSQGLTTHTVFCSGRVGWLNQ